MDETWSFRPCHQHFEPGFLLYGIPVGSKAYVRHHLNLKVIEVTRGVEQVLETLEGEGQSIWTVALMKLSHLTVLSK